MKLVAPVEFQDGTVQTTAATDSLEHFGAIYYVPEGKTVIVPEGAVLFVDEALVVDGTLTVYGQTRPIPSGGVEVELPEPFQRGNKGFSTNSIGAGVTATVLDEWISGVRMLTAETSVPARVRLYWSYEQMTDDLARPIGVDPTGNHGLLFELVTSAEILTYTLTPFVDFHTNGSAVYMAVTNLHNTTSAVEIDFYYLRTE